MKAKYKIGDKVEIYQDYHNKEGKTVIGTIDFIELVDFKTRQIYNYWFEEYSESRFEDEIKQLVKNDKSNNKN